MSFVALHFAPLAFYTAVPAVLPFLHTTPVVDIYVGNGAKVAHHQLGTEF